MKVDRLLVKVMLTVDGVEAHVLDREGKYRLVVGCTGPLRARMRGQAVRYFLAEIIAGCAVDLLQEVQGHSW